MTARESSECAICGRALTPDAPIVKTGEVIFDCHDPLWRFSDSGIHATCFRDWAGPAHVESVRT